jgi:hypothetical protein
MNNVKKYLITAITIAMLLGAFVFSGALTGNSYGAAPPGEVKVINSSAQPVPTVLTNTPTMKVKSDTNNPVFIQDVDNPARQPFQQKLNFNIADGFSEVCMPIATVPAGKRLIIEYVSARVTIPGGHKLRALNVFTHLNGDFAYHHLVPTPTNVFNEYVVGQTVRLYADPNTQVNICAARDNGDGIAPVLATISGYLVDLP